MAEAAAVLSQQIVQELLSASATALGTAFIGGALGAALLLRAGLLGWVLGSFTVRSIVVTRNPALSEAVDAHSPPDTVGAVDPAWARKRGIVALSSYFQQLEVAEGDREQWAESALLALLQGMGFGALAETSAGMLLAALPIGSILPASVNPAAGSHPLAATAAKAAFSAVSAHVGTAQAAVAPIIAQITALGAQVLHPHVARLPLRRRDEERAPAVDAVRVRKCLCDLLGGLEQHVDREEADRERGGGGARAGRHEQHVGRTSRAARAARRR